MRRKLALVVTFAMIFSIPTAFSAAPKVGAACTNINQFFESKSTLLVCATINRKKTWRKATSVEKSLYLKEKNRLTKVAAEAVAKVVPTPSSSPSAIANQDLNIQNINLAKSNGTYYQETASCHSNRIVSTLQVRNQQQWQDVAPGRGWIRIAENCFQPWTTYSATENQSLRWRLADPGGAWELFSQEFKGNKLSTQARVTPTPSAPATVRPSVTPTPSAAATVRPSVTPTPSAAATRAPTVVPTVTPTPSATATVRPSVTPTPSATATVRPSVTPTPSATATRAPTVVPTVAPTPSAATHNPLVISNSILTGEVGNSILLSTSGGSGVGVVTFSVTGSGCFLSGGTLVANFVTTCVVTASKAGSSGFNATNSAPVSFLFGQEPLFITNTVLNNQADQLIRIYYSGGNVKASPNFSVTGNDCSVQNGDYVIARSATTCQVTATQRWLADGVIKQTTSSPVSFSFYRSDPSPLVISNLTVYPGTAAAPASNPYSVGTWIKIQTTGGNALPGGPEHQSEIRYSASGAGCVMGTATQRGINAFSANIPTTCVITATKLASPGYNAVTTAPLNYVFENFNQLPLMISTPNSAVNPIGKFVGLSTTGGSGTGAVTYTLTGNGNCRISITSFSTSLIADFLSSTCTVTATKAASTGYNAVSSPPVDFMFAVLDQEPLVISNLEESKPSGNSFLLTTTGGSGTGLVTFQVWGNNCSLTKNSLTASILTEPALCTVRAYKARSTGYKEVVSATKSFTFTKL